jgi:unsaturated rhamnogalacturonyl hydrolase
MKKISFILFVFISFNANAQTWSEKMAATVMHTWKDSFALAGSQAKWTYDMGVVLKGMEGLWTKTRDAKYLQYIKDKLNYFVSNDGSIKGYRSDEFKLDDINSGKQLLLLYSSTGNIKYWKAASLLREQLRQQPRTSEGGFFHKKIYPHQMWLDGLYMAEPFYAAYAKIAG